MSQQPGVIVGRDDALTQLLQILGDARDGSGRVVLIYGEAGIGKTWLCQVLARQHAARGGLVLLGRAAPEESRLPLAPLADTLRVARRAEPVAWVAAKSRAEVLAALVPELADCTSGSGARHVADRPVLFETLLEVVEESTVADEPALWVLDDLHWADDATWHFVRYTARRVSAMSLVLVVTYRDEEIGPASPPWTGLLQLRREPQVMALPLGRLPERDAATLVRARAPELGAADVERVVRRSAGTPWLIEELTDLAHAHGRADASAGDTPPSGHLSLVSLPDVVLALVQERVLSLSPPTRRLLDVAALAGLTVDPDLIAQLCPDSNPGELVAAGLITRDAAGLRFRHPLLWEAVTAQVPPARSTRIHEELAAALAMRGSATAERVASHLERAGHLDAALEALRTATAEHERAGRIGPAGSLQLAAFHLASRHGCLARYRADLQFAAMDSLLLTRRWTDLESLIRDARLRQESLTVDRRVALALASSWYSFAQGRVRQAWHEAVGAVTALPAQGATQRLAGLHGTAAYVAWHRGDLQAAADHIDAGRKVVARSPTSVAAWWIEQHAIRVASRTAPDWARTRAAYARHADAARELGMTDGEALCRMELARHGGTTADIDAALSVADRIGHSTASDELHLLRAAVMLLEGRPDDAEPLFTKHGRRIRLGEPVSAPGIDVNEALLQLHRGDVLRARAALGAPPGSSEAALSECHAVDRAGALGWLAWEQRRWADAAVHFDDHLHAWPTGRWNTLAGGPWLLPLQIDALIRLDRRDAARAALEIAPEVPEGASYYRAARAAARFRLGLGQEAASEARAAAASAPWPWLTSLVSLWDADARRAPDTALAAAELAADIGAARQADRAERVLTRLGSPRPAAAVVPPEKGARGGGPAPLTPREWEIGRLVAQGLSNPAIAARLYLSRPTVATHVSHILTKLDFTARTQIAAWIASRSPLDQE